MSGIIWPVYNVIAQNGKASIQFWVEFESEDSD